jgi:hypothetical protein
MAVEMNQSGFVVSVKRGILLKNKHKIQRLRGLSRRFGPATFYKNRQNMRPESSINRKLKSVL